MRKPSCQEHVLLGSRMEMRALIELNPYPGIWHRRPARTLGVGQIVEIHALGVELNKYTTL